MFNYFSTSLRKLQALCKNFFVDRRAAICYNKIYDVLRGDSMLRRQWQLQGTQALRAQAAELAQEQELAPLAVLLALGRGIAGEELPGFLGFTPHEYQNPYDLPDMDAAVERIEQAIAAGEHITVFGDYDCDGVTATALLWLYLAGRTEQVSWYLPDRHKEGYGLSMAAVDTLAERGTRLMITVDNGVSAQREIAHAKALGIDTVITDHHQIGGALPVCAAVVNPHREDCALPFRDYTGAGTAFLLVCALEGCEPEELLPAYGELLALGTVADVVPLLGDNRAFVRAGLEQLNESPGTAFEALLRMARAQRRPLGSTALSFTLGPRINAAGRMGRAEEALALLLAGETAQAERLAQKLELYNEERQRTEQEIAQQALEWYEAHPAQQHDRVLVFAGEGWHEGVIGIVASRMVERFGRPCLMVTTDGENAKGSARSLPGFHLFEAIHASAHLLQKYGGHELAAGFSLPAAHVEQLRAEINAYAAGREMPFPVQALDAKLNPARLGPGLMDEIALLEPFGQGNPQPVFALQKLTLAAVTPLSEGRHLRLTLEHSGTRLTAMAFRTAPEEFCFAPGDLIDLAVTAEANEYQGQRSVTLIVKNLKLSLLRNEALLLAQRRVEQVLRREAVAPALAAELLPARSDAAAVFRAIQQGGGERPLLPERIFLALQTPPEGYARVWLAALALAELEILTTDHLGRFGLAGGGRRAEFDSAPTVQFLKGALA
jgi:single-stranded-DNA-specific exonuclease